MILNDNSTQQINTLVIQLQNRITNLNNELKSLNKEIDDLDSKISDLEIRDSSQANDQANDIATMNAKIKANTEAISGKADKNHTHIKSQITDFDHNHDDRYYTESEIDTKLSGKSDTGHTHTKSEITDFPTSLPANGGTADSANNGFNSSATNDSTPDWGYLTSDNGYSNGRTYGFANGGGIATAEKDTKSSLQVDGDLYVHEGLDKVATLNDIFRVGDRRNTIGWADLSKDVNIDGSSNFANNVGRIEGPNAIIEVSNPSIGYPWPVTNSRDNNTLMDFGGAIQFFVDKANNHLYVRFADSVDMSAWGLIV